MHILQIEGMTCDACKRAISNAISNAVPGMAFEVDLRRKQVRYPVSYTHLTLPTIPLV